MIIKGNKSLAAFIDDENKFWKLQFVLHRQKIVLKFPVPFDPTFCRACVNRDKILK